MKRINNSDINFLLSPKTFNISNFTIKFYTVNAEQFYITKTQDNVRVVEHQTDEGETIVDYYLSLDWSELVTLGEGVLQYILLNNFEDAERPDNYYNQSLERTTQYYIDSNVTVDEDEAESYAEIIAELGDKINSEITRSTSADTLQTEALNSEIQIRQDQINGILDIIEVISGGTDLSNYYTKDETYNRNEVDTKIEDIDVSEQLKDYLTISSFTESEQIISGAINTNKSDIATLANQISNEVTNRENADNQLSSKIDTKLDASAYTPTDLTDYYKKSEVYNKTEIDNKGYITEHQDISGKLNISDFNAYSADTKTSIDGKQNELISGTNIKTINNTSILGSGNITIQGGGGSSSGFIQVTNPDTAETKVGLVNSLSQYYDTNIGKGAVIEGDGYEYNGTNYNIVASGNYSHAEGNNTTASGYYSHAEGFKTTASSWGSHAEGYSTSASGDYSHTEGYSTTASGSNSHAEGASTIASGSCSHAEGASTTASGDRSHAEGASTTASGNYSHAEGISTVATGQSSHAEGSYTKALGDWSHAEGASTVANGPQSHAEGGTTIASNWAAHAEGQSTNASGQRSHAEGVGTIASGDNSHAEGQGTTAVTTNSHAEGYCTQATGQSSHAEGYYTTASGESSHAEGAYTKAIGYTSHAEGNRTSASTESSHAEGQGTQASGSYSHAEGQNTVASSWASHAEGYNTQANGSYSHTEGYSTTASGGESHAEGQSTTASGTYSHAEGYSTSASGFCSHSEGWYTIASGEESHAEGESTTANGSYSHAEGLGTIANNSSEHASGRYNVSSSASTTFGDSGNTLFSVGNGTSQTRHNAFEIRQNGDIYITSGSTDIKLQDHLGGNADLSNYYTKAEVHEIVDDVVAGQIDLTTYAKIDWVQTNYALKTDVPKIWTGTESEFDQITNKDSSTIYFIK